ncbi:MAG: putative peptidoglycan glycosyltransferase FtsW [Patescibacteria group bacterium]
MSEIRARFPDKVLLGIIALLIISGLFIFISASFGLLTREGASWKSVLFSQFVFGLCGGLALGLLAYIVPIIKIRKYSFYILIIAIILCTLVFVPGLGLNTGGAARWILIAGISFQPSELLKIALIIFISAWAAGEGNSIKTFKYGLLPFTGIMALVGLLMLAEPDTGTYLIMFASSLSIFISAGGRIRHIAYLIGVAVLLVGILALVRPYVRERISTYLNPGDDPLGSSYQVRQSLLAIGSGKVTGRGFGQSVQKFQYLPEPTGDSIFAVLGEEFGFMGTIFILLLFISLALRGFKIASRTPNKMSRLLVVGIVTMITSQAFFHIGAMLGMLPLTGVPLPLVSHGGTAYVFTLASLGLLLQISSFKPNTILNKT